MRTGFLGTILAAAIASAAWAEEAPYIEAGKRLAEANCAQCHNIEPDGAFKLYPPSFTAIATYMDPAVIRMKIMYPDHYALMPKFQTQLFQSNLDDIVGYMQSLER